MKKRFIILQPHSGQAKIAVNVDHITAIKRDNDHKCKVFTVDGNLFSVHEDFDEVLSWIRGE